jgi:hypothetical protein
VKREADRKFDRASKSLTEDHARTQPGQARGGPKDEPPATPNADAPRPSWGRAPE